MYIQGWDPGVSDKEQLVAQRHGEILLLPGTGGTGSSYLIQYQVCQSHLTPGCAQVMPLTPQMVKGSKAREASLCKLLRLV